MRTAGNPHRSSIIEQSRGHETPKEETSTFDDLRRVDHENRENRPADFP